MKKDKSIRLMGTTIDLTIVHPRADIIIEEVVEQLKIYEQRFSANDPASELSKINQHAGIAPVKVHPNLYELIKLGKKHSQAPGSYLNIAIGPLIQVWRIGFSDAKKPSKETIKKILPKLDIDQVLLMNDAVYLKNKGMGIDLGALAKGYIADRIIDYLISVNTESALINLGGNLVTMGPANQHGDKLWRVGIRNPTGKRGQTQIILKVSNQSVVTSGVYERQLVEGNETFHHIFNPVTGYPIETDVASLTIVSSQSVDGEIWTSRLFGQSPVDIINILNRQPEIEGIVITKDGAVKCSEGIHKLLV